MSVHGIGMGLSCHTAEDWERWRQQGIANRAAEAQRDAERIAEDQRRDAEWTAQMRARRAAAVQALRDADAQKATLAAAQEDAAWRAEIERRRAAAAAAAQAVEAQKATLAATLGLAVRTPPPQDVGRPISRGTPRLRCRHVTASDFQCSAEREKGSRFCRDHGPIAGTPLRKKRATSPPLRLTDADCWRHVTDWQEGRPALAWHRETRWRDAESPTACRCGSRDLTWNGQTWWCNACDAPIDPAEAEVEAMVVYDVRLPTTPFGVASADEDADYRAATRLFHAGAVTHRPFGWVSPHWDRTKEGKRGERHGRF